MDRASSCESPEKYTEIVAENGKAVEASSDEEPAEGCRSCPAWTKILPPEYRNELKELSKLAGPVVSVCRVSTGGKPVNMSS